MKSVKFVAFALGMLLAGSGFSQSMKLASGKLDFLKGQKTINVVYVYDNMKVGKGSEAEYISTKVAEHNKDTPGKGDEWKSNWLGARTKRYQPSFEEDINKRLEEQGVKVGNYPSSPYTLILKTVFTEPGFNIGIARSPAYTNLEAVFVKTGSTNELAVVTMQKAPGRDAMGYDFDAGSRIAESYAKAGKSLAAFLNKQKAL